MKILKKLRDQKIIHPPDWLINNTMYLTIMGSRAYGVNDENSDYDYYGLCIPPKAVVFPHIDGVIQGFGRQKQSFNQWQQNVHDKDVKIDRDFQIYSIIRYFQLCMENNPNMIDSLFTSVDCVIHTTQISELLRDNRRMFLHKGCWYKFRGYSKSQWHKAFEKEPEGNRKEAYEKYGFCPKFCYHMYRLLLECEQILLYGDLDLRRDRELLKAIRRADLSKEEMTSWMSIMDAKLTKLFHESKLQLKPDEEKIKKLLLKCLEIHYGSLDNLIKVSTDDENITKINRIRDIINE